jgi:two-component system, cell cycle sensor histidine kinase and response regulator CckA
VEEYSFGDAVEGSDAVLWELDPATSRFTYVSGLAEALLGYPVATWLSEPGFWERVLHPQDRMRTVQKCRDAVLRRRDLELEYRAIAADGRVVWLRDHVRVVVDETDAVTKLRGVMVDITDDVAQGTRAAAVAEDRRLAERVLGVAAAASTVLGAQTLDALVRVLGTTCADIFSPDAVQLALYDESADLLEIVPGPHAVRPGGVLRVADAAVEPVVREGRSLLGTTAEDPVVAWAGDLPGGGRAESALQLAVRKGSQSLGVLTVVSGIPGQYDATDLAAGDALAGLAAAALINIGFVAESRATESALRSSERLLQLMQQVTTAANESATFEDAASRCLVALCRHTGWPTGHVVRKDATGEFVSSRLWERNEAGTASLTGFVTRIRYEYGLGLVGRVATTGRPVWIADVTREPGFLRTGIGAEVRGAFAFPVRADGEVAAVLEFFSREPVPPDGALMDAASQIGVQLGRVLERERAQERILFQARLLDAVGQAVVASDVQHRVVYWNRAAETLYGWTRDEAIGRTDSDVVAARASSAQTADIMTRLAGGQSWAGEFTVRRKDGTRLPVHITGAALYDAAGSPAGYVGVATDLSASKELEAKLRQAQRLEAVGQLAGGVAHYFNNLLTSIKGTVHLLLEDLPLDDVHRADIEEIRRSADRAASLTSQMLAFSRRQVLQPRTVDLNAELTRLRPLLGRRVGEHVRLDLELAPDLGRVHIDPHQFEQALLQLIANACEAIREEGRIVIRTDNVALTDEDVRRYPYEVRAGTYVMVCVEDDGAHVDGDEVDRIFDPFFTPRRRGGAAGLGLSTVYGIVKQSGGYIWVDSRASATTFRIVFPHVTGDVDRPTIVPPTAPPRRTQTLLLVEDEDTVRRLAYRILTRQGYTVLQATNGVEALEICNLHDGPIDLVVTDVVMPEMGGGELAERLREVRPDTPVLMVSGYAEDAVLRHGIAETRSWFLEKPFTPDALVRKVREVLHSKKAELETNGAAEGSAEE